MSDELAEIARLRAALEEIAHPEYGLGFNKLRGLARKALAAATASPTEREMHPRETQQTQGVEGERERKGFYVASRASLPGRPEMWRLIRDRGVPINSTWIDEAGEGETADLSELWARIEREVAASEALILYVGPDDFPLKGALVECGMALALGIPVRIVAPDVKLDPLSLSPLGSWARHPLVSFELSVHDALLPPGDGGDMASGSSSAKNETPSRLAHRTTLPHGPRRDSQGPRSAR